MADSVLINNVKISAADTITALFTSPSTGGGTIITAFTVANNSLSSASYKLYIVAPNDVIDLVDIEGSAISPMKIVVKDRFDSAPGIVNQVVPSGGTIRAENSTGDALNFYATGRNQ